MIEKNDLYFKWLNFASIFVLQMWKNQDLTYTEEIIYIVTHKVGLCMTK
jgi:hypothetical protein